MKASAQSTFINDSQELDNTNQRLVNSLLLNASFIDNPGLMHGKMGISILFFHLARQTKNKIYEDYAGELIDEIYEEITINTPANFENGLAGIGWGIEYLVQNKFIEADTDEVLVEFDNRIFKELIYNTPRETGLLNGIIGIGAYLLKRIQNLASSDDKIPTLTNKHTLMHLIDELERRTRNISEIIPEPTTSSVTPKLSNDNQTIKSSNNNPSKIFDITWDYAVLLWFLAEIYEQKIFNLKVEKIIQRLIEPLTNNTNLPKLHSNRLLLALALTKLQQTIEKTETIGTIKIGLLKEIKREIIKTEIGPNNTTIKHGTSGIAWIYKQLYEITSEISFKEELEYWITQSISTESEAKKDSNFGDSANQKEMTIGILEGIAGILFNWQTINNSNITHHKTLKQENNK